MDMKFEDKSDRLSLNEVKYWKKFFISNLKIGVELESDFDRNISGRNFHTELENYLSPSNGYGQFGKFGVVSVKSDGSLVNGAEICTIGRRLGFLELYGQYKFITDKMIEKGAFVSSRAGLHNHVLLDYGNTWNCLEQPVPGIIFKNFVQLLKMNAPDLVFLTSTMRADLGDDNPAITRMSNFCRHNTLMGTRVTGRSASEIRDKLIDGDRYRFMNCRPMMFEDNNPNKIKRFHFELRFPDGSLYPAQIAAQNILYAAMLIKAIKLSVTGTIGAGDNWQETKDLMNDIRTAEYSDRYSVPLQNDSEARLKMRASDMIDLYKPELDLFDEKVYRILKVLAETPVSIMLREPCMDTNNVNAAFEALIQNMYMEDMEDCEALIELINMNKITGHFNPTGWMTAASEELQMSASKIDTMMTKLKRNMHLQYDKTLGCWVIV